MPTTWTQTPRASLTGPSVRLVLALSKTRRSSFLARADGKNAQLLQFTDLVSKVVPDTFRQSGIAFIWGQVDSFTL